jgi:tetratricopeptide (TPR) repeat protein
MSILLAYMHSRLAIFPLLFLTLAFQASDDSILKNYKIAQELHNAGKREEAETKFKIALAEAYGRLGKILLAEDNYYKAVNAFERAVAKDAVSGPILIDQATAYFHIQQYQKAIDPLRKVIAANSHGPLPHQLLGKVYFMLRQFDQAAGELEIALKYTPADLDISYTLALTRLKQKRPAAAQQIFSSMLRKLGSRPEVHTIIGKAYRETGYLDEALDEFKKTIKLDPRYPRAHYNLGLTYLLKDGSLKMKEAGDEFKTELSINPEEFLALFNLGLVYVVERNFEAGAKLLEKAVLIKPQNPGPYLFLGNAYHGMGRFEKAIECFRKSMTLDPNLDKTNTQASEAHFLLGQSLFRIGRTEEGERELEIAKELKVKALSVDRDKVVAYLKSEENNKVVPPGAGDEEHTLSPPRKTEVKFKDSTLYYSGIVAKIHNQLGQISAARGNFSASIEQFSAAIEWDERLKGVQYNLGLAYFKSELFKEAITPLESEVKYDATNISAKHLLGMCYFMTDDFTRASLLLKEVLPLRTNNVGLYYTLSLSLIKEGKVSEANDTIRKMLEINGDSPQVHILLGQMHHAQNDDEKALEELRKASQMDKRLPMAHYYSGLIYIKLSKFDEAAREFEAELTINPKDFQAKYHLGFVFLTTGQTARGISIMKEVLEIRPNFADARFEIGKALLLQGEVKGAIEMLETAIKLGPDKPHIHYQLGRAYLAGGRETDAQKYFESYKQLKDKERNRTNLPTNK